MVELKNADQASGVAECTQGDATETQRKIVTVTDLNEEQLEGIFSEEDPHKQFEFFASCLGLPKPENMSILSRIAAEYDYLNVMFCREQNFTAEQTIAFRGITQSVFEAGIVRGELDVNEAFQEFTERVLSLAGETDTAATTTTATVTQDHTLSNEPSATSLTSGVFPNTNGGGDGGRGSPPAAETRRTSGKNSPKVVAGNQAKEVVVDPKLAGKGNVPASKTQGGVCGGGGGTNGVGGDCSGSDSGGGSSSGSGGGGGAGAGPVFSVGDVAAITLFVARGLYRNFALYRMCFERPAKHCTEVREVQVETPLEPAPLHEAEPVA